MDILKRIFGIVWIALGPVGLFYLIRTGASDLARNPGGDTIIQWGIFVTVFIPIAIGLIIFGYYCLKGAYGTPSQTPTITPPAGKSEAGKA